MKMPTVVAAILLAGLVGMACSSSGLRRSAGEAGAASGGQAGSTISSGTTGGSGGTIGPGGAGGGSIGGAGGQGGTTGSPSSQGFACSLLPMCNPGDQESDTFYAGPNDLYSPEDCPTERECYSLNLGCGGILCILPAGVHCSDLLSCNPGDIQMPQQDPTCARYPSPCYTKYLCTHSITCKNSAYGGICRGTWSDGGVPEPPDASADGSDAGRIPCCGDGTVDTQYGEQCDLGPLNGACLDANGGFVEYAGPGDSCPLVSLATNVICTQNCQIILDGP
jgi:hypothetical protein